MNGFRLRFYAVFCVAGDMNSPAAYNSGGVGRNIIARDKYLETRLFLIVVAVRCERPTRRGKEPYNRGTAVVGEQQQACGGPGLA